jgi:ubiquitin-like modifier-activating enzyme ATG7
MPIVQFQPFSSLVEPSFWHVLTDLKINVFRLSDEALPITASYTTGRSIKDRETGQEVDLGCNLSLGGDAFQEDAMWAHLNSGKAASLTRGLALRRS